MWFLNVLDKAQHRLLKHVAAEGLTEEHCECEHCTAHHTTMISYLLLFPDVPTRDDILMNLCKATVQPNTRSDTTEGIAVI